jgi:transposase
MSEARLGDAHQDSHQDRHQGGGYRRIELITGEARRRPWTAEEKAMILAESFQPGAKVADVARRHGMNRSLLWNWRHEARKRGAGGERAFVPIRVVDERAAAPLCASVERRLPDDGCTPVLAMADGKAEAVTGTIEIEMRGARVRVSGVVDAAALHQVLSHLGRKS